MYAPFGIKFSYILIPMYVHTYMHAYTCTYVSYSMRLIQRYVHTYIYL